MYLPHISAGRRGGRISILLRFLAASFSLGFFGSLLVPESGALGFQVLADISLG